MPSFDIVSKIDMPSVQNGLDGVKKKLALGMILKEVYVK